MSTPSATKHHSDPHHGAAPEAEFDSELNMKAIIWTGIGTLGITAISMILMWWLFRGLEKLEDREDPRPPALAEAAAPRLPPEPRLEESPPANLATLREREQEVLTNPAWIDQGTGTVRLPLDLAIDIVARRGLGGAPVAAEAPASADPTPPAEASAAPVASAPSTPAAPAQSAPHGGGH